MSWNACIRWCAALGMGGASLAGWMIRLPGGSVACGASLCFGLLSLGAAVFRWERYFLALGLGHSDRRPHWKDLLLTTALGVWCVGVALAASYRI